MKILRQPGQAGYVMFINENYPYHSGHWMLRLYFWLQKELSRLS